jgi:nucleotide-binding universal stress UspA family protein
MFKTIYASMTGESDQRAVLETSLLVARLFEGVADCVHVRLDAEETMRRMSIRPFSTDILTSEQIRHLEREAREHADAAHRVFESFRNAHLAEMGAAGEFPLRWQLVSGIDTDETIARSRAYDLVVVGRDAESYTLGKERLGAIVMACGRPVLLAPQKAPRALNGKVVLAWKNCPEAARAVSVAYPLLTKASQIMIVHAAEEKGKAGSDPTTHQLTETLKRHGCWVETHQLADDGRSATERLRSFLAEIDADLIVMGAYGRSRLREFIFGGVTNSILDSCPIPVLLFH